MDKEAALFDENAYEPQTEAGNVNMLKKMIQPGAKSNEQEIDMSSPERGVRDAT